MHPVVGWDPRAHRGMTWHKWPCGCARSVGVSSPPSWMVVVSVDGRARYGPGSGFANMITYADIVTGLGLPDRLRGGAVDDTPAAEQPKRTEEF